MYYAARDGFAGAICLNDNIDYISRKNIQIFKGEDYLEFFQLVLQVAFEVKRKHPRFKELFNWIMNKNIKR